MSPIPTKRSRISLRRVALCYLVSWIPLGASQQQQDPLTMNGGSVLAMAGKDCIAVAVDKRFGSGPALVQVVERPPLLVASPTAVVAWTGLQSDVQSMQHDLSAQLVRTFGRGLGFRSSHDGGDAKISPRALASLTSHVLYQRKRAPYYVEPLVIGLEKTNANHALKQAKQHVGAGGDCVPDNNVATDTVQPATSNIKLRPFLCSLDMIGALSQSDSFVCAGAASKSLYGTAQALWKQDMAPDDLVRLCGQAFLTALERDCLSGYGALVYLITSKGIVEYDLESRND